MNDVFLSCMPLVLGPLSTGRLQRKLVEQFFEGPGDPRLVKFESTGRHSARVLFQYRGAHFATAEASVSDAITDRAEIDGALTFKLLVEIQATVSRLGEDS